MDGDISPNNSFTPLVEWNRHRHHGNLLSDSSIGAESLRDALSAPRRAFILKEQQEGRAAAV